MYSLGMANTRDHAQLEKRRLKAGKLFAQEHSAPEVARRLGVARQVAYRWKQAWEKGGKAALASKGPAGPKRKLTAMQTQKVTAALLTGPLARGYKTNLWTLPRVALLIQDLTGVRYHPGHVWRLLGAVEIESPTFGTILAARNVSDRGSPIGSRESQQPVAGK